MEKVALLFSGGEDSVLALAALRKDPAREVVALVTTFTDPENRLAMHRIRRALVEAQAASVKCRLEAVHVPLGASNRTYQDAMNRSLTRLRDEGVRTVATGDLHLQDIRAYREAWLRTLGLQTVFPIWGHSPFLVAREFVDAGYRAAVICIDRDRMPAESVGKEFDHGWLDALPAGVDPCGEGGEFHTFVHDGPGFAFPIPIARQTPYSDQRFTFAELDLGPHSLCTVCNAPFTCGAELPAEHCWCMAEPKIAPDLAAATCMCPRCLADTITRRSGPDPLVRRDS
ncbi:MAG: ATP-binding protein [Betaproteobacteria bacterium]|nr:ATP-binding protein [Betaproteobacteria bacterium]